MMPSGTNTPNSRDRAKPELRVEVGDAEKDGDDDEEAAPSPFLYLVAYDVRRTKDPVCVLFYIAHESSRTPPWSHPC